MPWPRQSLFTPRTVPAGTLGFFAPFGSRDRNAHFKEYLAYLDDPLDMDGLARMMRELFVGGFSDFVFL